MWELLRDPMWQFIGVAVALGTGLASLGIGFLALRQQRRRKSLTYQVLTKTPLATVREDYHSEVEIRYRGEPVQDVSLVTAKLSNSGNTPIARRDYETNIDIIFGPDARILSAEILDADPKELADVVERPLIDNGARTVFVRPCLLNPSDYITIKVLVEQFDGDIAVSARIKGVKRVRRAKPRGLMSTMILTTLVGALFGAGSNILYDTMRYAPRESLSQFAALILFAVAAAAAAVYLVRAIKAQAPNE